MDGILEIIIFRIMGGIRSLLIIFSRMHVMGEISRIITQYSE